MRDSNVDDHSWQYVVEGLLPLVRDFIETDWDWKPWKTEPPQVPLVDGGPSVSPPGHVSETAWTIAFEGAYPWAIDFSWLAHAADGPVKVYCDQHRIGLEAESGYAISIHSLVQD